MNKYHSKATVVNGIKFPSILEADRYSQLLLMLRAGEISNLKLQVEFVINQSYIDPLTGERMRSVVYVADFVYFDNRSKRVIVEDTKGVPTAIFRMKWRQVQELYPQHEWRILTRQDV